MADIIDIGYKVDSRGIEVANKRLDRMQGELRQTGRSANSASSGMSNLNRSSVTLSTTLSRIGVGALGIALVGVGRQAVNTASDFIRIDNTLRVATNSVQAAKEEFAFLERESYRLGLGLTENAIRYARLAAAAKDTALEGQATRDIFVGIASAARATGLSSEQMGLALTAVQQIISKGRVSAEELRGQLGERIPGAVRLAAKALNVTQEELSKMLELGEVAAEDLIPKLAVELSNMYGAGAQQAAQTYLGVTERLNNELDLLLKLLGEDIQSGLAPVLTDLTEAIRGLRLEMENSGTLRGLINQVAGFQLPGIPGSPFTLLRGALGAYDSATAPPAPRDTPERRRMQFRQEQGFVPFRSVSADFSIAMETTTKAFQNSISKVVADIEQASEYPDRAPFTDKGLRQQENDLAKRAARIISDIETPFEAYIRRVTEAEAVLRRGGVTQEEFNRAIQQYGVDLNNAIEKTEEAEEEMSTFAEQAARNMQSAFADFLFDPFSEGLDGMVLSFTSMLRRLAAESAAAAIFDNLGIGDFFSGLFSFGGGGGSKTPTKGAMGGPMIGGIPRIVGDDGPEIFVPTSNGQLIPNYMAGGGGTNVNVTSTVIMEGGGGGGVDAAAVERALNQRDKELQAKIELGISRKLRLGHA